MGADAMRIESTDASIPTTLTQRRERDHRIQDTFSAVLAAAGREGYASAQAPADQQPLTDSIQTSWDSWFTGELSGRYEQAANPDAMKHAYGDILVRAHQEGAYANPKDFLSGLSRDDLAVVQHVQWLAEEIDVESLTVEGAVNLLLPPAAQVDLNHDGLTRSGAAFGIKFPDSRTPAAVVTAWEEATAGMDFGELAVAQLQIKLPLLTANMQLDENGSVVNVYEPGDPEWTNPMDAEEFSYVQLAKDRVSYTEFMKNKMSPEQYERQKLFWTNFQELLGQNNAR